MGVIATYLTEDHRRLEKLLSDALRGGGIDAAPFEEFRAGLLRHIGLEEKILLPAARRARGGEQLPVARELRIQHGAIASLLVPTPTPELIAELQGLLAQHNELEEGPDALYETCERLVGQDADSLVAEMRAAKAPPLAKHYDGPGVHRTAALALAASAGSRRRP
jgi:hypothetical protein